MVTASLLGIAIVMATSIVVLAVGALEAFPDAVGGLADSPGNGTGGCLVDGGFMSCGQ